MQSMRPFLRKRSDISFCLGRFVSTIYQSYNVLSLSFCPLLHVHEVSSIIQLIVQIPAGWWTETTAVQFVLSIHLLQLVETANYRD